MWEWLEKCDVWKDWRVGALTPRQQSFVPVSASAVGKAAAEIALSASSQCVSGKRTTRPLSSHRRMAPRLAAFWAFRGGGDHPPDVPAG